MIVLQPHHPGIGPGAMHTDDQDFVPPEFFSSAPQQQMGGPSHGMQNLSSLTQSPSWGGPATQPEQNWFGPGDNTLPQGGRGAMPHAVSAPSLGMLQQQQPTHSAPSMGAPPIMRSPVSHSQSHIMSAAPWQSPNHSTQSAPPPNNGGGDLEERLKEIMNQSNAAMSTPVNFHAMSGQVSMDSTGGTRDGAMEVGTESASQMTAQHYAGSTQPSPAKEVCICEMCANFW